MQRQEGLAVCSLKRLQVLLLLLPRQPAGQGPSLELNLNASHSSACRHTHGLRQTTAQCLHPSYLVTKHASMHTPTEHLLQASELCLQLCLEVLSYIPRKIHTCPIPEMGFQFLHWEQLAHQPVHGWPLCAAPLQACAAGRGAAEPSCSSHQLPPAAEPASKAAQAML